MEFSNRIINYIKESQTKEPPDKTGYVVLSCKLNYLKSEVKLFYKLIQTDETYISKIFYETNLVGPYLGVLEGYINFAIGKPVEVMDRITPKELDYFLRDKNSIPAFSYYPRELYEILTIGELLVKNILGEKIKDKFYDKSKYGDFVKLSFCEQVEFFEEFCAEFIYPNPKYKSITLSVEEVTDSLLILESEKGIGEKKLNDISEKFNFEFESHLKFLLN